MKKVDVPQILVFFSAIFGIALVWYEINVKVFHTVRDLLRATLYDDKVAENVEEEDIN